MASVLLYSVLALAAIVYYFYRKLFEKLGYFKEQGIPQLETEFFYGNARELIQKKICQGQFYQDVHNKFKKMGVKHGGIYMIASPIWVPVESKLIKTILVKDFPYFAAHIPPRPLTSLFFRNLFLQQGNEWKDMRRKLTPTFTTGKMKMMFNIILEKSKGLSKLVNEVSQIGEATEIKKLVARFTTDVIASCGFGLECNSIEDENSEVFKRNQNLFKAAENNKPNILKDLFNLVVKPDLRQISDITEYEKFFSQIVRDTIDYREKNKVVKKDFIHLMIELKNKGAVTEGANVNEDVFHKTVHKEVVSVEDIIGQCFLFFQAGYETSATTMSFALLELTQYPEIQKKLTEEVREVLKRHNGIMTYEALQEMKYVDNVIQETLRKYPAVPTLPRVCTKDYQIPGTSSVIKKGTMVNISILGLHMDPDNFPDPEKFIPERFNDENKHNIKEFTFLPFGEGPRMCLGLRFGIMQSKAGLATLMKDFHFTLDKNTPYPPKYKPSPRLISIVDGGVWVKASKVA